MITKKQFVEIINAYNNFEDLEETLRSFGISLTDSDIFNCIATLFDNVIYSNFDEETSDIIMEWMFDEFGKYTDIISAEDMWDYLVKHEYIK